MTVSFTAPAAISPAEESNLRSLFAENPREALGYCDVLLWSGCQGAASFDDFLKSENDPADISACQVVGGPKQIMFHCKECSLDDQALLCLDCFVKGNHAGHQCSVVFGNGKKCSCGDRSVWKSEGFCPNHGHSSPEKASAMEQGKKEFLSKMFSLVLDAVRSHPEGMKFVTPWLVKFIKLGDRYVNIIANIMTTGTCLDEFLKTFYSSRVCPSEVSELLERLASDPAFHTHMSKVVVRQYAFLLEQATLAATSRGDSIEFRHFSSVLLSAFKIANIREVFQESGVDWLEVFAGHVRNLVTLIKCPIYVDPITTSYRELASGFTYIMKGATQAEMQRVIDILIEELREVECKGVAMIDMGRKGGILLTYAMVAEYLELNQYKLDWSRLQFSFGSVDPDAPISKVKVVPSNLVLHVLAGYAVKNGTDIKTLTENINDLVVHPLRLVIFIWLYQIGVIADSRIGVSELLRMYTEMGLGETITPYLEVLVQRVFIASENRELLVRRIAKMCGLFAEVYSSSFMSGVGLAFFFCIVCLLTDDAEKATKEMICEHMVESVLQSGPKSLAKILAKMELKKRRVDDTFVRAAISRVAATVTSDNHTKFKRGPSVNPFHMHFNASECSVVIQNQGCHIPPILCELEGVVKSPTILAVCHYLLALHQKYPSHVSDAVVRIIVSLLAIIGRDAALTSTKGTPIFVKSLDSLVKLAEDQPFQVFAETPFVLKFCECPASTLVELIGGLGEIGREALDAFGCAGGARSAERAKAKARAYKEALLAKMKSQQSAFREKNEDKLADTQSTDTCVVCGEEKDEPLCHQILLYNHSLLKKRAIHMLVCPHPVHPSCVRSDSEEQWHCPLDRAPRNALIPSFPNGYDKQLTEPTRQAVTKFVEGPITSYDAPTTNKASTVTTSLLNSIKVVSIRLKDEHSIDDNAEHLLRLLFLTLWHCRHMSMEVFDEPPTKPKRALLARTLESDSPEKDFKGFVKEIANGMKGADLYKFLRFAAILDTYCVDPTDVDMTEELEFAHLISKYEIDAKAEPVEIKGFDLTNLPERMVDLALPPFNITGLDDQENNVWLCLTTGTVYRCDEMELLRTFAERENSPVRLVLCVCGKLSGRTYLFRGHPPALLFQPSIYRDQYGDEETNYENGQLLYLDRRRLAECRALLVSGRWIEKAAK